MRLKEQFSLAERIREARLYCVTCPPKQGQSYEDMVEEACKGGADVIQLREKNLPAKEIVSLGKTLKTICAGYETVFIVNDRIDVALACGADGVHLGQDDLPVPEARKIAGNRDFLIGCSTHSLEQAQMAQVQGADYIGVGPVFSTPTKPGAASVGLQLVRHVRENLELPFVAIGGIDAGNVGEVLRAGASCVAVVRAVFDKNDIKENARALKLKLLRTGFRLAPE